MEYPGNLFVVAAPSGAGKSSLVKALMELDARVVKGVVCCGMPAWEGDRVMSGQDYRGAGRGVNGGVRVGPESGPKSDIGFSMGYKFKLGLP